MKKLPAINKLEIRIKSKLSSWKILFFDLEKIFEITESKIDIQKKKVRFVYLNCLTNLFKYLIKSDLSFMYLCIM